MAFSCNWKRVECEYHRGTRTFAVSPCSGVRTDRLQGGREHNVGCSPCFVTYFDMSNVAGSFNHIFTPVGCVTKSKSGNSCAFFLPFLCLDVTCGKCHVEVFPMCGDWEVGHGRNACHLQLTECDCSLTSADRYRQCSLVNRVADVMCMCMSCVDTKHDRIYTPVPLDTIEPPFSEENVPDNSFGEALLADPTKIPGANEQFGKWLLEHPEHVPCDERDTATISFRACYIGGMGQRHCMVSEVTENVYHTPAAERSTYMKSALKGFSQYEIQRKQDHCDCEVLTKQVMAENDEHVCTMIADYAYGTF